MAWERDVVISNRKELTYLLCQAAELEHGLMCEYLYAAFSLKQRSAAPPALATAGPRRSSGAAEHPHHRQGGNAPLGARQQPPHRRRVSALGEPAPSHRGRGRLPGRRPARPAALRRTGPAPLRVPGAARGRRRPRRRGLRPLRPGPPPGRPQRAGARTAGVRVGEPPRPLDRGGLATLAGTLGEKGLFIGPPRAQATPATFRGPDIVPIADLGTAVAVIERIVEQGEGALSGRTTTSTPSTSSRAETSARSTASNCSAGQNVNKPSGSSSVRCTEPGTGRKSRSRTRSGHGSSRVFPCPTAGPAVRRTGARCQRTSTPASRTHA